MPLVARLALLLAAAAVASAAASGSSGGWQSSSLRHGALHTKVEALAQKAPAKLRLKMPALPASAPSSSAAPSGHRVSPVDFGGDPTGRKDSLAALQQALSVCLNQSALSPNGLFPGSRSFGNGHAIRDMGGCFIDLEGGEYLLSGPLVIPEYNANMQLGFGSLVAGPNFPSDAFLIVIGIKGSCKVPQGSCNIDLNFPALFMDGANRAAGCMQINNVMGVTIGPGGYFLNFTQRGVEINAGHEVMIDRCWLGETNFDFDYVAENTYPNATAIQINGNDHFVLDTIVFSSLVGVEVNGAADLIVNTHVWFPVNKALHFNNTMAFHITGAGNRFEGCYIDGGRAVFESAALSRNTWTMGFECCAGSGLGDVPHGILLKGDKIGSGLQITHNEFAGGSIYSYPSDPSKLQLMGVRIEDNSFGGSNGKATRARATLTQKAATAWNFDLCDQLLFPVIHSVQVSVNAASGFPVAVARPTTNCTVLVETSEPVTGSVSIVADSSGYDNSFL